MHDIIPPYCWMLSMDGTGCIYIMPYLVYKCILGISSLNPPATRPVINSSKITSSTAATVNKVLKRKYRLPRPSMAAEVDTTDSPQGNCNVDHHSLFQVDYPSTTRHPPH